PDAARFWEHLLNNTVKWTASSPDDRQLDLAPVETIFDPTDPVVFTAFLRTPSGEPKETGTIELSLTDTSGEQRTYLFRNEQDGQYRLELDPLPEGSYEYTGTARRGEREIEQASGSFSVGGINLEFINTRRNDALMEEMARVTGGHYVPHEEAHTLPDLLEEQIGFEQTDNFHTTTLALYRHPGWFIVVLLLLTLEWILRKYKNLS
ncbi:hypothetical protein QLX67_05505, partial [Balneolaceae bacterium ANBcel3]|nr:hypothetical protein [Balneolaceae bacterium ANBcel3]